MRYVIGAQVFTKEYGLEDGVITNEIRSNKVFVLTKRNEMSCEYPVFVFDSVQDAQKYANHLNRQFKNYFKRVAFQNEVDKDLYRIYPIKADSIKFTTHFSLSKNGNPRKVYIKDDDYVMCRVFGITRHPHG